MARRSGSIRRRAARVPHGLNSDTVGRRCRAYLRDPPRCGYRRTPCRPRAEVRAGATSMFHRPSKRMSVTVCVAEVDPTGLPARVDDGSRYGASLVAVRSGTCCGRNPAAGSPGPPPPRRRSPRSLCVLARSQRCSGDTCPASAGRSGRRSGCSSVPAVTRFGSLTADRAGAWPGLRTTPCREGWHVLGCPNQHFSPRTVHQRFSEPCRKSSFSPSPANTMTPRATPASCKLSSSPLRACGCANWTRPRTPRPGPQLIEPGEWRWAGSTSTRRRVRSP